jgi:hypothetical protein
VLECGLVNANKIVSLFKKKLGGKFIVTSHERFYFDNTYYVPDITLRGKKDRCIKAIVEIEQCSRKHVVGGVLTADYCMSMKKIKPIIFVLSLKNKNKVDYQKRIPMLKKYVKALRDIIVGNKKEVLDELTKIET